MITQKKMLAFMVCCLALVIFIHSIQAKEHSRTNTGRLSFGFTLQEWEDDLGLGIEVTSPWVLDAAAVRIRGSVLFKEDHQWEPYFSLRAGLVGGQLTTGNDIRLYGEGGFLFLFPSSTFDDPEIIIGGYGHFGFEFFFDPKALPAPSFFIELGTNGIQAWDLKDNLYLNGFAVSLGMRLYL